MSLYSALSQVLAPFAAKIKGIQTGYDGTEYDTPGEAVREQINNLHVLIGHVPGQAIDASAVAYNDSNVAAELTNVNGRLHDLSDVVIDRTNKVNFLISGIEESGLTVGFEGGRITLSGTTTAAVTKDNAFSVYDIKPSTTYVARVFNASGVNNSEALYLRKGTENLVSIHFGANGRNGVTFTTPADVSGIYGRLYVGSGITLDNAHADIMITEGDTIPEAYTAPAVVKFAEKAEMDTAKSRINNLEKNENETVAVLSWERGTITNGIDAALNSNNIKTRIRTSKILHIKKGSYFTVKDAASYVYVYFYDGFHQKSFDHMESYTRRAGTYTFTEDAYVRFLYYGYGDPEISPTEISDHVDFKLFKADNPGVDIIFMGTIYNVLGDLTVVKFPSGKILMIDAWGQQEYYFSKYMLENGITHVDYFILSHYHGDHMGMFHYLVENGYIDADTVIYLPQALDTSQSDVTSDWSTVLQHYDDVTADITASGATPIIPAEGDVFCIDGWPIEFWNVNHADYYPGGATPSNNYNDYSLCNYLTIGNVNVGFSGDLGWVGQEKCAPTMRKCHIYKAQHHGWDNDPNHLIPAYINRVVPDVVFSEDNVGHNAKIDTATSPMQTWCERNGVSNYRTAVNGNMLVHVNEDGWYLGGSYARYIRNGKNWSFSDNSEHIEQ